MWTLFAMMTMDDWSQVAGVVVAAYPCMTIFFCIFIFLSFASVSIIPAIFLEIHLYQHAQRQAARAEAEMGEERSKNEEMLRKVFHEIDVRSDGIVTLPAIRS